MPGLNQLKQFSEDIKNVGDEPKIRAQRGEKPVTVSIPDGISERDDSEDFLLGMPEVKKDEPENSSENLSENAADSTSGKNNAMPDLDSILTPQGESGDEAPDLSDFMDDLNPSPSENENPASSENLNDAQNSENSSEETPLEDLDLDDLLNSISDSDENVNDGEKNESGEDIGDFEKSNVEDADVIKETPPEENAEPKPDENSQSAAEEKSENVFGENSKPEAEKNAQPETDGNPQPKADEKSEDTVDDVLPDTKETNPDAEFDFDGQPINLNDDLPDDVLEKDGVGNSDEKNAAAAAPMEKSSDAGSGDLNDLPDMNSDDMNLFDTSDLDQFAPGTSVPSDNSSGENPQPSSDSASGDSSNSSSSEIPDASLDVPGDDSITGGTQNQDAEQEIPPETFDTSEMEGMDFTPKTDKKSDSSDDEFPVTGEKQPDDDFVLDDNFTIPGFSDTETADLSKKAPVDTVDFKGKAAKPKNTLTDEEYEQFKKNLSEYPLNLRLAIEDFIAKNEFTDDAVFEIIEKVLKKTPARQVASQLEKMLDISINVPRDFEKRSFEQYEAYKQSFQYTLKNRIIPAAVVGIVLCFVCFGLFKAAQKFIYEPVMANINYKQGYVLLENNEFPQSEDKFSEAVSHKPVKKWFFKFANGYRAKKQYERAANIYRNALEFFDHDLEAGKQYAEMELYDRANYERAEEIVRREILDYHINNPDGLLLLGDVFLEWASVDDSKYELAKNQYVELLQRYGEDNLLYLSRMLRYYIRTDNLREVLNLKNVFYQKKNIKSLNSDDWTELSGYLLDKLYGKLDKNDEYLRSSIEDVRSMLEIAVSSNSKNPVAHYNLARYFVNTGYIDQAKNELETSLELFDAAQIRAKKDVYREINASRILGELYAGNHEYLKAQEVYTHGADLYNDEHDSTGFEGDENTGKLFADLGDIDYFVSGDLDSALYNYNKATKIKNDTPSVNYRIGTIYYGKEDYDNALPSFLKVHEKEPKDSNVLLALGNTLVLRNDNFAAQSYYKDLLSKLDLEKAKRKILLPQEVEDEGTIVDLYLKASNNLGVALYRTAQQTGNSQENAESMVHFTDAMKAYDSLTRDPRTMIRMEGGNLPQQNLKYISHPHPDFEPGIMVEIPKVLSNEKEFE